MSRTAKRKRRNETNGVPDDTEKATPLITRLPFELVAEILLYSTSPADILSLSRTCKHFGATLVQNPAASFIWKRVRSQTIPPVPDPTKLGLSEPQLANFIYGEGKCTICGAKTNSMYASFSARVRLCGNSDCRMRYSEDRQYHSHGIPQHALGLPWIEWTHTGSRPSQYNFVISDGQVTTSGMPSGLYYNSRQLLKAENEYNKATLLTATFDEYKQRQQEHAERLEGWMNGCLELCKWKWELRKLQDITTTNNRTAVEGFAVDKGREKGDVRDTPTVARFLQEKLLDFKRITRNDLEALWPEIEADLARIEEHRRIVKVEVSRVRRSLEVERLYRKFDHAEFDCFPSLPQFRRLPTLQSFQDSGLDVGSTEWKNDFVGILVKTDVQKWATKTVQAFSERLGYPEWPSTNALAHPVRWISTRFTCTRCSKTGPKATRNKSLTFREAAHHLCLVPEEGNKDQWSPKNFDVDAKASAVITQFAIAVGVDVQEKTATDLVDISRHVMCLSCSGPIVMEFDAMIQHSHRHEDMQFMILTDEELVKFSDYPALPGITAMLMKTKEQAKKLRGEVYFGCKHCVLNPLAPGATEASSDGKTPKPKKESRAFSFDGLRSHLKEKHKVMQVADEDVFAFNKYLGELGYKDGKLTEIG